MSPSDDTLRTAEYKGFKIKLFQDTCAPSPREDYQVGKLVLVHRRRNVGDQDKEARACLSAFQDAKEEASRMDYSKRPDLFDLLRKTCEKVLGPLAVAVPVSGTDHGGMYIYAGSPDRSVYMGMDSMPLGWAVLTKAQAREMLGHTRLSKADLEWAEQTMRKEIKRYAQWSKGGVLAYCVDDDEEYVESWGGFYSEKDAIESAKEMIDTILKEREAEVDAMLKKVVA